MAGRVLSDERIKQAFNAFFAEAKKGRPARIDLLKFGVKAAVLDGSAELVGDAAQQMQKLKGMTLLRYSDHGYCMNSGLCLFFFVFHCIAPYPVLKLSVDWDRGKKKKGRKVKKRNR